MSWLNNMSKPEQLSPVVKPPVTPAKPVEKEPGRPVEAPPKKTVIKPDNLESTCPAPHTFGAVDLSQHCTQRFLDAMKYLGVKTIIRYYDWPGSPTLPQKIPTAAELALIKKNGFRFLGVFQHSNNRIGSFTKERGHTDARVALDLAQRWGQPTGSCIYFGVDFDPTSSEMAQVKAYAAEFSKEVRAAGFKVGAYGSGATMEALLASGHIEKCWLSMSTGFRRTKEFAASGKWHLKQVLDRNCGGINCDFDYTNGDIGDWELP